MTPHRRCAGRTRRAEQAPRRTVARLGTWIPKAAGILMGQDDALRRAQAGGTGAPIPGGHAPVADPPPPRIRHTGAVDDEGPAQKAEVAMLEIGRLGMPASTIGGAPAAGRAVPAARGRGELWDWGHWSHPWLTCSGAGRLASAPPGAAQGRDTPPGEAPDTAARPE